MRRVGVLAAALASLAVATPAGAQPPACVGDTESDDVAQQAGPRLRFGIGPRVQAGQIGPMPAQAIPEQVPLTLAALGRLAPPRGAFVLRLNRFFWSDREEGFRRFLAEAERYTDRGYLVELQVRYHPDAAQEGDIPAWTEHVREVVRRFGENRGVIALQIANEVNFTFSADSSDGAYEGAREALVLGVIAAKDEARRRRLGHLQIGFNWAYRLDPASEQSFWQSLRDRGGAEFVRSVDWIGLDAYPGTVFPPEADLDGYRDGMVNAMSALRCYASVPGIPPSVPMKVEENGWPTFPGRSEAMQEQVLRQMVRAVHDFRGTYNVTDYRWFNLRDGDSRAPQPFQHFGLLRDDYSEKPAFPAYRELVAALARVEPDRGLAPARLSLALASPLGRTRRGGTCARGPVLAGLAGADARLAARAEFFRGARLARRDENPPLRAVIDADRHLARAHRHFAGARVRLLDGRLVRVRRSYLVCAGG